jgi:hypothetical protein
MKIERAPKETYADIGGLTTQLQEIKVNRKLYFLLNFKFCFLWKLLHSAATGIYFFGSYWDF